MGNSVISMRNCSATVNFIVGEFKRRVWIAIWAFSSSLEELEEARKLCSRPGRGSPWTVMTDGAEDPGGGLCAQRALLQGSQRGTLWNCLGRFYIDLFLTSYYVSFQAYMKGETKAQWTLMYLSCDFSCYQFTGQSCFFYTLPTSGTCPLFWSKSLT